MISDAISSCNAEGVSVCYAHPDLEVFRVRLGKALNYEFNEDTQLGLFQRREPREGETYPNKILPMLMSVYKPGHHWTSKEVNLNIPPADLPRRLIRCL